MSEKTYVPEGEVAPSSQIATTIEALAATIRARRDAGEESYTHQLLYGLWSTARAAMKRWSLPRASALMRAPTTCAMRRLT